MPPPLPPKEDVHSLIPGACEYVTLHGIKGFAGVVKVRDLEMGRLSEMIGVSPV